MLALLLAAQVAAAPADTATYASPSVRALVTQAARLNRVVPPELGRYRAKLESEITLSVHDGSDREMALSVEQVASDLTWTRTGEFAQHMTGYRTQRVGFAAMIGLFRNSWFVPSLYGNRLALMWGANPGRRRDTTYYAVHPLADDRERYYRFSGGDTVEVLRVDDREIRIARINVSVRDDVPRHTVVFVGELDLDLARMTVVRMRGAFYVASGAPQQSERFVAFEVLQFVEIVNSEVNSKFWLPEYQRFEAQIGASILGQAREAIRIVTYMRDVAVETPDGAKVTVEDSLRPMPHRITFAPEDSLGAFHDWQRQLGKATATLGTEDFNDVGPERWRPGGMPTASVEVEHLADLAHFNRIEGVYTGLGAAVRLRDAAPGVTLRASGGYAWGEQTARGRASAELKRGAWTSALRGGRSLDITNDFRNGIDSGSSLGALLGFDPYDYVDRLSAGVSVSRAFGQRTARIRVESGWASDRAVVSRLSRSPIGHDDYLANRGIDAGSYARSAVTLEWHRGVLGEDMIRPGLGASLSYVRGDGELNFQRVEFDVAALSNAGPWRFGARVRAGTVFGNPPPQQLFELGGEGSLSGFDYKQFAGNNAALLRTYALYHLPFLQGPLARRTKSPRIPEIIIPGLTPALFVSLEGGWTGVNSDAARAAILRLGTRDVTDTNGVVTQVPVSTTTGNPRGSVGGGISFFEGLVGFGIARSLDRIAKWRGRFAFGLSF